MLLWYSKSYFDNRTETENRIFTFKICFDIRTASEIVFCHSKSYLDIRTESENHILIFEILFWRSNWVGKCLTYKILFWHSNWVGKSYFDTQNSSLTFELSWKMLFWYSYFDIWTESENRILTFKNLFWHSKWVG